MEVDYIQEQIEALDREERNLKMELDDVLTDVTSPENSDDDDEEEAVREEENNIVKLFKDCILTANGQPTTFCSFLMRYEDPIYRERVRRKMKKMKNQVKASDIEVVLANPEYMVHLERIRRTYTNHGGREFLNELVATYLILNA